MARRGLFGSPAPCQSLGLPGASGIVYVLFWFSSLFFLCLLPAVTLCGRRGSCLLFSLSAVKRLGGRLPLSLCFLCVLAPCVSRPTVTLTCSDHVQLSPPVDLCVRELSPPLGILFGGCGMPGENLLPCMPRPLSF